MYTKSIVFNKIMIPSYPIYLLVSNLAILATKIVHQLFQLPMSDNIPKDLCERQINAYLGIPTEMWTDIFMLLPRRTLVQRVQPVNKVFKAICDKNVKSIHIIGRSEDFMWKLGRKKPKAQQHLEALAGNDCALASHFRMTDVHIYYNGSNEIKLAILRHSLDLLRHCQLIIDRQTRILCSPDDFIQHCLAYLTLLEPAKPSYIKMRLNMNVEFRQTHLSELFRHPTTLNCPRLKFFRKFDAWPNREAFFDWLHHRVDVEEHGEEVVRCLNFLTFFYKNTEFHAWLIKQCVQNFKKSKVPEDRRCFLYTFEHYEHVLDNFERKNPATGEVLLLERVMSKDDGHPTNYYRLLRCLAHRVANGTEQLYAKLFDPHGSVFNLERAGDVAKVKIF